jgi:hypothetical protein
MMIFLQKVVDGTRINNLTIIIMEALQNGGGLSFVVVAKKLLFWGADGVSTFQGIKIGVTKQINTNYAPYSIGVHCMIHNVILHSCLP